MSTKSSITVPGNGNHNVRSVTWATLVNGDAGDACGPDLALWSDQTVQVTGTFGAAGTVVFEGSNDGTNWFTLNNPQGTALSFTAAGLKKVQEGALYVRPHVTGGDGTTAIAVVLMLRLPTLRQN
jgi:hypothetical protein